MGILPAMSLRLALVLDSAAENEAQGSGMSDLR